MPYAPIAADDEASRTGGVPVGNAVRRSAGRSRFRPNARPAADASRRSACEPGAGARASGCYGAGSATRRRNRSAGHRARNGPRRSSTRDTWGIRYRRACAAPRGRSGDAPAAGRASQPRQSTRARCQSSGPKSAERNQSAGSAHTGACSRTGNDARTQSRASGTGSARRNTSSRNDRDTARGRAEGCRPVRRGTRQAGHRALRRNRCRREEPRAIAWKPARSRHPAQRYREDREQRQGGSRGPAAAPQGSALADRQARRAARPQRSTRSPGRRHRAPAPQCRRRTDRRRDQEGGAHRGACPSAHRPRAERAQGHLHAVPLQPDRYAPAGARLAAGWRPAPHRAPPAGIHPLQLVVGRYAQPARPRRCSRHGAFRVLRSALAHAAPHPHAPRPCWNVIPVPCRARLQRGLDGARLRASCHRRPDRALCRPRRIGPLLLAGRPLRAGRRIPPRGSDRRDGPFPRAAAAETPPLAPVQHLRRERAAGASRGQGDRDRLHARLSHPLPRRHPFASAVDDHHRGIHRQPLLHGDAAVHRAHALGPTEQRTQRAGGALASRMAEGAAHRPRRGARRRSAAGLRFAGPLHRHPDPDDRHRHIARRRAAHRHPLDGSRARRQYGKRSARHERAHRAAPKARRLRPQPARADPARPAQCAALRRGDAAAAAVLGRVER